MIYGIPTVYDRWDLDLVGQLIDRATVIGQRFRAMTGAVVLLMAKPPEKVGQILIPTRAQTTHYDQYDENSTEGQVAVAGLEPSLGVVLASGDDEFKPGDLVMPLDGDGLYVDEAGDNFRFYGRVNAGPSGESCWVVDEAMPPEESLVAKIDDDGLTLRPTGRNVLIEVSETMEVTEGGIYVPSIAQRHQAVAKVLEAGPKATSVQTGNTVVFLPSCPIKLHDQTRPNQFMIRESAILAVVR